MIIDIHAHVWDDPGAQRRREAEAGVDTTVLLSTRFHPESCNTLEELSVEFGRLLAGLDERGGSDTADPFVAATDELLSALRTQPSSVGFVNVPLADPAGALAQLDAYAGDPRIKGIGELTPAGGEAASIEHIFELAEAYGRLPILTHGFAPNTENDLRTYAALANRFPTVPLIVGAFGGTSSMTLIMLAKEHPNLYVDLSSALQVFMVRAAADLIPEQCLFGSNSPYGDPVAARSTVEAAVTDPALRQLLMGENASALLGL